MIEAVNSTLATSALTREAAGQQSSANSFAANPERVQRIAQAPYVSPYIAVDTNFDRAVLQIRDSDTGDVLAQYPTEPQLEAYRRAQQIRQEPATPAPQPAQQASESAPAQQASAPEAPAAPQPQPQSAPVTEAVSIETQA